MQQRTTTKAPKCMVCYGFGYLSCANPLFISVEAAGRLYLSIPEVVLYLYKQKKNENNSFGCSLWEASPLTVLPLHSQCFSQRTRQLSPWNMWGICKFCAFQPDYCRCSLALCLGLFFCSGGKFSTSSFPLWVLASDLCSSVGEVCVRKGKGNWLCVCPRAAGWVCINQEHTGSTPNQTWEEDPGVLGKREGNSRSA